MNWISVKDRLPQLNTEVLALMAAKVPIVVWYQEDKEDKCSKFFAETYSDLEVTVLEVTHWIEFKDVPKPENENV